MGFFVASIIAIGLFCFNISALKLFKEMFAPALILAASMLVVNLLLVPKNFMAVPGALFCILTMCYLYQKRRELIRK